MNDTSRPGEQGDVSIVLRLIFERQWLHILTLVVLLALTVRVSELDGVRAGQLWGVDTAAWLWLAVVVPIAHQAWVWLCWRTQLHASLLTRMMGRRAFAVYAVVFAILGIGRVMAIWAVAVSNRGTVEWPAAVLKTLAVIALIPALYLFYSVGRYFGFKRAMGIDHFDDSYRSRPLVNKGIFRFTSNGMYLFGFAIQWAVGFWYASLAALWVALFTHIYIWIHYFSTELPDMRRIYGADR